MTSAAFVAALKTQLETRFANNPTFAGVGVTLYQIDTVAPSVALVRERVRHEVDYTRASMGPIYDDVVTIPGMVGTKGELLAAADQAAAIIAEIRAELATNPPQVGLATLDAKVETVAWIPLPADDGETFCITDYDITYTSNT